MIENDVQEPMETYHVYRTQGGILIRQEEEPFIDSTPIKFSNRLDNHGAILMLVSTLIMGLIAAFAPSSPISEQIILMHTFSLSDLRSYGLLPVTGNQSITVAATGRGHQDAKQAQGTITFYNGLFTGQTIAQGTILTGADGVQVITDQDALLPAANPPTFGQVVVPAHALHAGATGNIPASSIDEPCCSSAVKAINTDDFTGGVNARDYHMVRQQDINKGATSLRQVLYGQAQKSLHAGPDATVIPLPCSTRVTANHHPGEEAASVKVMVAATCSGIAYSRRALQDRARQLLHIPGDFILTRLAVHVVRTTPTSVIASIQYTMLYDFTERNGTE